MRCKRGRQQCSLPLRRRTGVGGQRSADVFRQSPRIDGAIGPGVKHLHGTVVGDRGRDAGHVGRHRGHVADDAAVTRVVHFVFGRIGFVQHGIDQIADLPGEIRKFRYVGNNVVKNKLQAMEMWLRRKTIKNKLMKRVTIMKEFYKK